jgi:hypothetical protein
MFTMNGARTVKALIWILISNLGLTRASAFCSNYERSSLPPTSLCYQSTTGLKEDAPITDAQQTSADKLSFKSSFAAESNPVPAASVEDTLAFFQVPEHLSFGDSMPSSRVTPTPDLVDQWKDACHRVGATLPNLEQDVILSVRTAGVSIPGLTIYFSAYIGTTLIQHPESMLPAFEFVLIKDESVARGIKPLMWIYEKLMNSKKKQQTSGRETRFLSRVALKKTNDDDSYYCFSCSGTMEINFKVPSVVQIALGKGKSKSEAKMSTVITNQIEKDMVKALAKWQTSYESWIAART